MNTLLEKVLRFLMPTTRRDPHTERQVDEYLDQLAADRRVAVVPVRKAP